jgi:hypothetical protein
MAAAGQGIVALQGLLGQRRQHAVSSQVLCKLVVRGLCGVRISCIRQLLHLCLPLRCFVPVPMLLLQQLLLPLLLCLQLGLLQLFVIGFSLVSTIICTNNCGTTPKSGAVGGARRKTAKSTLAICCGISFTKVLSCGTEDTSKVEVLGNPHLQQDEMPFGLRAQKLWTLTKGGRQRTPQR